jgi:transcriptional regulator with XRE-family HTH domain
MFKYYDLKKYLEQNGYKQKFVAEKVGIKASTLSDILNGKRKCRIETYVNICMLLKVPFSTFITT